MSDVVSNDELNALAAEYVLGTLDYEERKGAAALLEVDPTFRGIVRIWERRFGDLHLMVESVEPDPQLWLRIKPKMAGVEQVAPAIPSSKMPEEQAAAEAAPALAPPAEGAAAELKPAELKPAESMAGTVVAEAGAPAPATPAGETKPDEAKNAEAKPAATPPAIAETELKLAELAALLPVAGEQGTQAAAARTATAEPVPEDGLHTHAPDIVPRGFVPPAPMSTRGSPAVVEKTVLKHGGRGWMAATLMMALIAVALAGLISAWRFIPERLPPQLRANAVLNLTTQAAQPAPKAVARPRLAPFDE
ncbi:MAG: hypothetical protein K2Y71_19740 [Xanthobacteraceae bacterium]|nr:hypothetical protein [Xanthobacteraceae bacterium]